MGELREPKLSHAATSEQTRSERRREELSKRRHRLRELLGRRNDSSKKDSRGESRGIHLRSKVSRTSAQRPIDRRVEGSEYDVGASTSNRVRCAQTARETRGGVSRDSGAFLVEPSIKHNGEESWQPEI